MLGDRARLKQVIVNLLDNAIRFTKRGGTVWLRTAADDIGSVLEVSDSGIGIPSASIPHVFDRFFRVPGQSSESGTGLGLAIVREIVTAHGGKVECDSQLGIGTVFRLTLPAAEPNSTALPS